MPGIDHTLDVDVPHGPTHAPSTHWAVAGLAVATTWSLRNGQTRRVEKVVRKELRHEGEKAIAPRIIFEDGHSMAADQFIGDVKTGEIDPKDPGAHSLAVTLNHPDYRDDGDSSDE